MKSVLFTIGAVWSLILIGNAGPDPLSAMLIPCALIGLSAGLWAEERT